MSSALLSSLKFLARRCMIRLSSTLADLRQVAFLLTQVILCLSMLAFRYRMLSSTAFAASAICTTRICCSTLTRLRCGHHFYSINCQSWPLLWFLKIFALDSAVSHVWTILNACSNVRSGSVTIVAACQYHYYYYYYYYYKPVDYITKHKMNRSDISS